MKNGKDWYLKYFVIGTFFLLAFIAYQLYGRNTSTPQTKLDCLKLGSDDRAAACIKLLEKDKLVNVMLTSGNDEIILGTKFGLASRFNIWIVFRDSQVEKNL